VSPSKQWAPVRPYPPFHSSNPKAFDLRTKTFIPEASVSDIHVHDVGVRKLGLFGAKVYNTGSQLVGTGTTATLSYDTEAFDVGDFFDEPTDDETLVIPFTGVYICTGAVEWASHATGSRRVCVVIDGTDNVTTAVKASDAAPTRIQATAPLLLEKGTEVTCSVSQNSGGNLSVSSGEDNNFLSCVLMGTV
jgi:hypothetical protein